MASSEFAPVLTGADSVLAGETPAPYVMVESFLVTQWDASLLIRSSLRAICAGIDEIDSCFETKDGETAPREMSGVTMTSGLARFCSFAWALDEEPKAQEEGM